MTGFLDSLASNLVTPSCTGLWKTIRGVNGRHRFRGRHLTKQSHTATVALQRHGNAEVQQVVQGQGGLGVISADHTCHLQLRIIDNLGDFHMFHFMIRANVVCSALNVHMACIKYAHATGCHQVHDRSSESARNVALVE